MFAVVWALLSLSLFTLAVMAGLALRARLRERLARPDPVVDDATVRAILEFGVVVTDEDEPLDFREIDEQERRFWSETWDEGEEW